MQKVRYCLSFNNTDIKFQEVTNTFGARFPFFRKKSS